MDLNKLAKEIALREGKKVQVNIAQIKEILRVMNEILIEDATNRFEPNGTIAKKKPKRKSKRGGK